MTKKKINKPRAEQEPRSAHGRAVNKRSAHGRAVKKPVQSKNRARPMAARLKKPRAEQEPRSAHGRAVKKPKAEQETAQPTAARFKKKPRAEQEPRSAHGRAVNKYSKRCLWALRRRL